MSVVYLDDALDVERSEASSTTCSSVISSNVASADFVANVDKSVWVPDQVIVWLGIRWDGIGAQGIMFRVRIFTPTEFSRFLSVRKVPLS